MTVPTVPSGSMVSKGSGDSAIPAVSTKSEMEPKPRFRKHRRPAAKLGI